MWNDTIKYAPRNEADKLAQQELVTSRINEEAEKREQLRIRLEKQRSTGKELGFAEDYDEESKQWYVIRWDSSNDAPGPRVGGPFPNKECATYAIPSIRQATFAEGRAKIEQHKVQMRLEDVRQHMPYSGTDLDGYEAATPSQKQALYEARNFARDFARLRSNLVLCGLQHTGKTRLACALAETLAIKGPISRYVTLAQLVRAYHDQSNSWQTLRHADVLIVDGVGIQLEKGTATEWLAEMLAAMTAHVVVTMLKHRQQETEALNQSRPVVLVCDGDEDSLERFFGPVGLAQVRESSLRLVVLKQGA